MKNKIISALKNKYIYITFMFFVGFFYKTLSPTTTVGQDLINLFIISLIIFAIKEGVLYILEKDKS